MIYRLDGKQSGKKKLLITILSWNPLTDIWIYFFVINAKTHLRDTALLMHKVGESMPRRVKIPSFAEGDENRNGDTKGDLVKRAL